MAKPFTIYQITILYMLDRAAIPLSNTQIVSFFLEEEYTDYFKVQRAINNLAGAHLIRSRKRQGNTQYSLTQEGKNTLGYLKDKLTEEIVSDVKKYFAANQMNFRRDNSVTADYYRTTDQKYAVNCQVCSDGCTVIDLTLSVDTKEQAEAICLHWKKQNEDVYAYLMDMLLK